MNETFSFNANPETKADCIELLQLAIRLVDEIGGHLDIVEEALYDGNRMAA